MKASAYLLSALLLAALASGCKTTSTTSSGSSGSSGSSLPSAGGSGSTPSGGMPGGSVPGGSTPEGASSGGTLPGGTLPDEATAPDGATAGSATGSGAAAGGSGGQSVEDLDGELDGSLEDFDDRVAGAGAESGEIDILDPTGRNTGGVSANVPVFEEADVGAGDVENPDIEQRAEEGYEGAEPTDTVAGTGGMGSGESFPAPDDVGDGQGDDIVLRQIREAAMQESDPVLREKLWDEYRRIKGER